MTAAISIARIIQIVLIIKSVLTIPIATVFSWTWESLIFGITSFSGFSSSVQEIVVVYMTPLSTTSLGTSLSGLSGITSQSGNKKNLTLMCEYIKLNYNSRVLKTSNK